MVVADRNIDKTEYSAFFCGDWTQIIKVGIEGDLDSWEWMVLFVEDDAADISVLLLGRSKAWKEKEHKK